MASRQHLGGTGRGARPGSCRTRAAGCGEARRARPRGGILGQVDEEPLRLLALWHARRRDLDEMLEPLLAHGPVAVERVARHLPSVTGAVAGERAAFDAFLAAQDLQRLAAQAVADRAAADDLEHVHDRFVRAREQARRYVHPASGSDLERDHVVVALTSRSGSPAAD